MHDLKAFRESYPKACYKCGVALDGAPESDEDLEAQLQEHDELFPGEPIDTSCVICDRCFHTYCPGGKKIGMN